MSSFTDNNVFMNGKEQGPRYFSVLWKSVMAYLRSSLNFMALRSLRVTSFEVCYEVLCLTFTYATDCRPLVAPSLSVMQNFAEMTCEFDPKNVSLLLKGHAMYRNKTMVSQQKNIFLLFSLYLSLSWTLVGSPLPIGKKYAATPSSARHSKQNLFFYGSR